MDITSTPIEDALAQLDLLRQARVLARGAVDRMEPGAGAELRAFDLLEELVLDRLDRLEDLARRLAAGPAEALDAPVVIGAQALPLFALDGLVVEDLVSLPEDWWALNPVPKRA